MNHRILLFIIGFSTITPSAHSASRVASGVLCMRSLGRALPLPHTPQVTHKAHTSPSVPQNPTITHQPSPHFATSAIHTKTIIQQPGLALQRPPHKTHDQKTPKAQAFCLKKFLAVGLIAAVVEQVSENKEKLTLMRETIELLEKICTFQLTSKQIDHKQAEEVSHALKTCMRLIPESQEGIYCYIALAIKEYKGDSDPLHPTIIQDLILFCPRGNQLLEALENNRTILKNIHFSVSRDQLWSMAMLVYAPAITMMPTTGMSSLQEKNITIDRNPWTMHNRILRFRKLLPEHRVSPLPLGRL